MKQKTSFPTIRAEITDLMHRIQQHDLPGKIKRETLATDKHDNFKASNGQRIQPLSDAERQLLTLLAERDSARDARVNAERDVLCVKRDIENLSDLLNADVRAERAKHQIETTTRLVVEAQTTEATALATCTEIDALVAAESQALETARGHAAGSVLAQVKAGTTAKLPAVNCERLATLKLAQEAAAAELIETQYVLAECSANLEEAHHEHAQALADGTARTLHVLSREYAAALSSHKAAAYACGLTFDAPDLDFLIRQLENETDSD